MRFDIEEIKKNVETRAAWKTRDDPWPTSKCCGKREVFKIEGSWIVCGLCSAKYRPHHRDHLYGPFPGDCAYCREKLNAL